MYPNPYLKIRYGYPISDIHTNMDTDMVLNFNYPYPNNRYILYSLIYIMKKIMLLTIIKSG